jgi:hypothetical protein
MQVKDAVQKAGEYLPEVFNAAEGRELRLEGVEKTDDGRFWKVTFSYESGKSSQVLMSLSRDYKTVKLRDVDGEFMGAQDGNLLAVL